MNGTIARLGESAIGAIERQYALDGLADMLQSAVRRVFAAAGPAEASLKNILHGTWLGHPLHAVLTDIPVGAWTASLVLDLLDGRGSGRRRSRYAAGADAAVVVGIAGAVAAALPGLADWHHTRGGPRRSGLVHALLNTATLALYTGSLGLRRAGRRTEGRALSGLGFTVLLASAYIGGHLVYRLRIGVDRSQPTLESDEFLAAGSLADLRDGVPTRVDVEGASVLLVRRGGRVAALAERCSHLGGPLAEGRLEGDSVRCPWHGSRFSLEDGRVLEGPATAAQPCFETRVREGRVEIRRRSPGDARSTAGRRGGDVGTAAS